MSESNGEVKTITVPRMRIARHIVISADPELDAAAHMDDWARRSGLLDLKTCRPRRIGWDFPFVSKRQEEEYGLRGYVSAYVVPDDFTPKCGGAEFAQIEEDEYLTMRIPDPRGDRPGRIAEGYEGLARLAKREDYRSVFRENRIAFEEEFELNGQRYVDIYLPH